MSQEPTYRIVRMYKDGYETKVIRRGLTLKEAKTHCKNPETSSSSAAEPNLEKGPWFDGYEEE